MVEKKGAGECRDGGGGGCARHLYIGSGALGVSADEFFAGSTIANGENTRNEVEHLQSVRLVLVEEVHAVSDLHNVGAVRMRVVFQDELRKVKE